MYKENRAFKENIKKQDSIEVPIKQQGSMKVALYARVSTLIQDAKMQKKALIKKAELEGWKYNYFEEQEKELNKKKKLAQKIAKEVESNIKEIPYEQEATISKGIKAVKSFYNNALNNGDYLIFGAPQNSIEIMGRDFWMNHNVKRKKKKIKVRMIFNESIRYHGEASKNKYTTIKYFDKDFEPLTEVHIQKDIVAMIVWTKEPFIFKINSKIVAESYKEYFNRMWKLAKK